MRIHALLHLQLAYKILDFLHLHCIRTTDYNQYGAKQGAWALITGARAGIGKGFAEALAKRGFNLIMTARNASQLAEVAKDLETRFSIKTQCLNVDSEEKEAADKIAKEVRRMGLKLTVLVNNVGNNVDVVNVLSDTLDTDINKIINVNVTFTTMLTKLMIPIMACPDKRALIINLSSYSGRVPVPLLATYAASKVIWNILHGVFFNTFVRPIVSNFLFYAVCIHVPRHTTISCHALCPRKSKIKKR